MHGFRLPTALAALALALGVATAGLAAPASYQLRVDGLSCPFCAYGIEKKLGAVDGVKNVQTHIQEGKVVVTMKNGMTLDEATARRAVKAAGFTLRGFSPASGDR